MFRKKYIFGAFLAVLILTGCSNESKRDEMVEKRTYSVAMIQMRVSGGSQSENLARAVERITEAADSGASLALLPEILDFGWTHSSAIENAGPIPGGKSFETLRRAAIRSRIYICAGIAEREEDQLFNSAVLIDPGGELLLKHRKLNELDFAQKLYGPGRSLRVVNTELGKLGVLICADATAPDLTLSKSLGMMGADIILSPSAWAVPPDHNNESDPYGSLWVDAYRPISQIFKIWYIGVSNVGEITDGEWKGWNCIGSSIAMNADGKLVVQASYGVAADEILFVDVQLQDRPARGTGWYDRMRGNR